MNDLIELKSGKDWIITITIPNRLLWKYAEDVNEMQNTIQLALLRFNSKIKSQETEKATVKKPNLVRADEVPTDIERQVIVAKMEKERRQRGGGGGLSGTD